MTRHWGCVGSYLSQLRRRFIITEWDTMIRSCKPESHRTSMFNKSMYSLYWVYCGIVSVGMWWYWWDLLISSVNSRHQLLSLCYVSSVVSQYGVGTSPWQGRLFSLFILYFWEGLRNIWYKIKEAVKRDMKGNAQNLDQKHFKSLPNGHKKAPWCLNKVFKFSISDDCLQIC